MQWKSWIISATAAASMLILICYRAEDQEVWRGRTDHSGAKTTEAEQPMTEPSVRVLIRADEYQSLFHEDPPITCDVAFLAEESGKKTLLPAGELYRMGQAERVVLFPTEKNGTFWISGLKRSQDRPGYRGNLELIGTEEGTVLINELPLEEYLPSVVSSEMPSGYPEEALKAQAICARTYAMRMIREEKDGLWGADLDDSVSFQVYNNIGKTKETIEAVEQTKGQFLTETKNFTGSPAEIYYYSTSCGATREDSFSREEDFYRFITSVRNTDPEADKNWYRWSAFVSAEKLTENLKRIIGEGNGTEDVEGESKNDAFEKKPVHIEVTERKENGQAEQISIVFHDEEKRLINGEYEIRRVLAPDSGTLVLQDGSVCDALNMLPSAWFSVEESSSDGFFLRGGGYGHGNGLSQNGACCLAEQGMNHREILKYYYPELEICEE